MIPPEQLEHWAKLYDLGHRNLDGWFSQESIAAREELNTELWATYQKLLPGGSIPFGQFRRKATEQIKALLKSRPPSM